MKTVLNLCLILVLAYCHATRAEIQQIGPNYFSAGVSSHEFEYFAAPQQQGRQRQENWCWAATIQMVLNFHGLYVSQEDVVARVFGNLDDLPGTPQDILNALSGWAPDVRGRYSSISADPYVFDRQHLVPDLAYKWPLIVGLRTGGNIGHAYVLTAVYYSTDGFNLPVFDKVVLRDPWPANESRLEMSWAEFVQRRQFMARVYVERQ